MQVSLCLDREYQSLHTCRHENHIAWRHKETCQRCSISHSPLLTVAQSKLRIPSRIALYQHVQHREQSGAGGDPGISLRADEEHQVSGFDQRWCVSASSVSRCVCTPFPARTKRMCQVFCLKVRNFKSSRQCLSSLVVGGQRGGGVKSCRITESQILTLGSIV